MRAWKQTYQEWILLTSSYPSAWERSRRRIFERQNLSWPPDRLLPNWIPYWKIKNRKRFHYFCTCDTYIQYCTICMSLHGTVKTGRLTKIIKLIQLVLPFLERTRYIFRAGEEKTKTTKTPQHWHIRPCACWLIFWMQNIWQLHNPDSASHQKAMYCCYC